MAQLVTLDEKNGQVSAAGPKFRKREEVEAKPPRPARRCSARTSASCRRTVGWPRSPWRTRFTFLTPPRARRPSRSIPATVAPPLAFSRDGDRLIIVDNRIRWFSTVKGRRDRIPPARTRPFLQSGFVGRWSDARCCRPPATRYEVLELPPGPQREERRDAADEGRWRLGSQIEASTLSVESGWQIAGRHLHRGKCDVFDTATGSRDPSSVPLTQLAIVAMAFSDDEMRSWPRPISKGRSRFGAVPARSSTSESTATLWTLKGHRGAITAIRFSGSTFSSAIDQQRRGQDGHCLGPGESRPGSPALGTIPCR